MSKYYTIAEVSSMLGTSKSNLRYLETTKKKFRIKKIRARRYYTEENIEQLKSILQDKGHNTPQLELFKIPESPQLKLKEQETRKANPNLEMIARIERLEMKFKDLQNKLKVA